MFKRLLIANRGEIASRIIKTARRLNITTLAIYSDIDAQARYVEEADEAFHIGPALASESYLAIAKIIDTALRAKADAIHPGYGFLAENPRLAQACEQAGIIFVGPSSAHMQAMGLKDEAKALAAQFGAPVVPGYSGENQDLDYLLAAAKKIQFPILIKPIAGGGGKGMQVVEKEADFAPALAAAKRLALASFGNDRVLLEKYLPKPRHIEIQILGDPHGQAIYLFERDCSLQRRYQKIIEIAPAPFLSAELRVQMGEAALNIVRGLGYVGAGTIEFLLDGEQFYFMEMNTRLQVEHGVTELITGVDLVEWQLRIASGEALSLQQTDLSITGAAIEARLYAEDPGEDFLPATGSIAYLQWGDATRIDSGIKPGDKVSIYYDPMLAKILVHADTHVKAWQQLSDALQSTRIAGVKTNINFLRRLAQNPVITTHSVDTHFIDVHQKELCQLKVDALDCVLLGLAIALKQTQAVAYTPWQNNKAWRLNSKAIQTIRFFYEKTPYTLQIEYQEQCYKIYFEDQIYDVPVATLIEMQLQAQINQQEYSRNIVWQSDRIWLLSNQQDLVFMLPSLGLTSAQGLSEHHLRAPMPGKIVQVLVASGDAVSEGQALMVLEAMKMEHTVRAPQTGNIKAIYFQVGDQLQEDEVVIEME